MRNLTPEERNAVKTQIFSRLSGGSVPGGSRISYWNSCFRTGPRKWRAGQLSRVYDPDTGEIKSERLKLGTWNLKVSNPSLIASQDPPNFWVCDSGEIEALRALLNSNLPEGHSVVSRAAEPSIEDVISEIAAGRVDVETASTVIAALAEVPELASFLATQNIGTVLMESVEVRRRRDALHALREAVDREAGETEMHDLLKGQSWIFGGRYIGEANRRRLTIKSTLDMPLIRGDNSLHVVELKGVSIPGLVKSYREAGGLGVGATVNDVVGQVVNYLKDLDARVDSIWRDCGIDCSRSSATILLGDSRRVPGFEDNLPLVRETIRSYNAHLSRIEVMTYDVLVDNADRALNFTAE